MKTFFAFIGLGLLALAGCGPAADVRLFQPQYVGAERDIHLQSEHVCWAPEAGEVRVLAEFPLPGAVSGRPTYLLYLRMPAEGDSGAPAAEGQQPIRGFLIQTQGRNAGLETLQEGQVSVKGKSDAPDAVRELQVDLTFEQDTRLSGRLTARRNDRYLKNFETRRRPLDVQALKSPQASAPAP